MNQLFANYQIYDFAAAYLTILARLKEYST